MLRCSGIWSSVGVCLWGYCPEWELSHGKSLVFLHRKSWLISHWKSLVFLLGKSWLISCEKSLVFLHRKSWLIFHGKSCFFPMGKTGMTEPDRTALYPAKSVPNSDEICLAIYQANSFILSCYLQHTHTHTHTHIYGADFHLIWRTRH